MKIFFSTFCLLVFSCIFVPAQRTYIHIDPELPYKTGLELFEKQKYAAAQKEFGKITAQEGVQLNTLAEAEYYYAVCAMELHNKDAEYLLIKFTEHHKESPRVNMARFYLGKLFYRQKNYRKAAQWFSETDITGFNQEELAEYHFRYGYANYSLDEHEKASKSFAEIKDKDTKYSAAAGYYYSHIAYLNKNYETALQGFLKLKDSENFGPVVPLYIAQIYFHQQKYDALLEYAVPLLDSGNTKNRADMLRLVSEAYYKKGECDKVISGLEEYVSLSPNEGRIDFYQLGYCYYKAGNCKKAIEHFKKVTERTDSLAQNAYYHLGDCFVKGGERNSARNAFLSASKMKFDEAITEDAMFNYAKLTYETSLQPAAIDAFRNFINTYPQSRRIDEANEMLVTIFTTTKNYRDALKTIESVKTKSPRIKAAYQKAAYYRGIELYSDNQTAEAISLFDVALRESSDAKISALALYWKGEAQYRQHEFDGAIKSYNDFIYSPAAVAMSNYHTANYNIGYCYFKKEDYANALVWFRKFIREREDAARYSDALLRIADGFFVQRDYHSAMDYYDRAVSGKTKSADYAYFQKGVILGLLGKNKEKIDALENILRKYPSSPYFDDALYETAFAHFQNGNTADALSGYKKITNEYPQSSYVKKAMLGEGLVYYRNEQDELALQTFKKVISQYPSSTEAMESLVQIENLYVKMNKVDEYLRYAQTIPSSNITAGKQDSLIYRSAELRYTGGDCDKAIAEFENYISQYPNGTFALNASFYQAQCFYQQKKYDDALEGFLFVLNAQNNSFTEKSLLYCATINFSVKKNYTDALTFYSRLESSADFPENVTIAVAGKMRCHFLLQQYEQTITQAQKLLGMTDVSPALLNETHLLYGKSAYSLNDLTTAQQQLSFLTKLPASEAVAEAKYYLAQIQYQLKNHKESHKICFEVINQTPAQDYWVTRSFILLADNYAATGDTFQAIETYKSVVENYQRAPSDPDDLREIAKLKLEAVKPKEPVQKKEEEPIKEEEEEME